MPVDRSQDRYGGRFSRDASESGVLEGYRRAVQRLDKDVVRRGIEPYKRYGFTQSLKALGGMNDAERFSSATKAVIARYLASKKTTAGGGKKAGGGKTATKPKTTTKPRTTKPKAATKPKKKVENVKAGLRGTPKYDPTKRKLGNDPPRTAPTKPPSQRLPPRQTPPRLPPKTAKPPVKKKPIVGGKAPLRV